MWHHGVFLAAAVFLQMTNINRAQIGSEFANDVSSLDPQHRGCPVPLESINGKNKNATFVLTQKSWLRAGMDLQLVIDCLDTADTLLLDSDVSFVPKNVTIITKPITIAALSPEFKTDVDLGSKAELTCPPGNGLFVVKSGNVTLSNLHIKDCSPPPILSKSVLPIVVDRCKGRVDIVHSKFENNDYGLSVDSFFKTTGGIGATGQDCSLNVWNVEFKNLTGTIGAVNLNGLMTANLTGVSFWQNTGEVAGAVLINDVNSFLIAKADFVGNSEVLGATVNILESGGALESVLFANNTGNSVVHTKGRINLDLANVTFKGTSGRCFFAEPSVNISTGGESSETTSVGVVAALKGVTFTDNSNGAALWASLANMTMEDVVFSGNVGQIKGGVGGEVVSVQNSIVGLKRARFAGNIAPGAGALHVVSSQLNVVDSVFVDNAGEAGGGLSAVASVVTGQNVEFHRNFARVSGGGMLAGGVVALRNATFVDNIAESGEGGGLAALIPESVHLADVAFIRNFAGVSGGALDVQFLASHPIFNNGTMDSVSESQIPVLLERALIESNTARGAGGGMHCVNCIGKIIHTTLLNNTSVDSSGGGASVFVALGAANLTLQHCEFRENRCAQAGGGLHIHESSAELTIMDGKFAENLAGSGGGLAAIGSVTISVNRVNFVGNEAEAGGAIWLNWFTGEFKLWTSHVKFVRNKSVTGGGLCVSPWEDLGALGDVFGGITLGNATEFVSNHALEHGGAIWLEAVGKMEVLDVTFTQNTAGLGGGAIAAVVPIPVQNSNPGSDAPTSIFVPIAKELLPGESQRIAEKKQLKLAIKDSVFLNNSSPSGFGGGILIFSRQTHRSQFSTPVSVLSEDSSISMDAVNVSFDTNFASEGGGIYANKSFLTMLDATFQNNGASSGGGLSLFQSIFDGERCQFVGNSAEQVGGGLNIVPSQGILRNAGFNCTECVMTRNTAMSGGAVFANVDHPVLHFMEPMFKENVATNGGGGALYHKPAGVTIMCPGGKLPIVMESIDSLSRNPCLKKKVFRQNRAGVGGQDGEAYGNDVATEQIRLATSSVDVSGWSGAMLDPVAVTAFDSYDQQIGGGARESFLVRVFTTNGSSAVVSGSDIALFKNGSAVFDRLSVSSPVSLNSVSIPLTLAFESEDKPRGTLKVELLGCRVGQVIDERQCRECAPGTFSTDPTQKACAPCPEGGICSQGVMVPTQGWWVAGPNSAKTFECVSVEGCTFEGRDAVLLNHAVNPNVSDFPRCRDGYQGVLCNGCQDGYGHTLRNTCRKCKPRGTEIGLVLLVCLISLGAMVTFIALQPTITLGETQKSTPSDLSTLWKIFMSHLQVLALIRFSQAQWPESLHYLLVAAGVVSTVGLGDEALFTCSFPNSSSNREVDSVVLAFVMPIMFLAVLWIIFAPWYYFKNKRLKEGKLQFWVVVQSLAASVYFHVYPFLAMAVLTVFNCARIDGTGVQEYDGTFWLADANSECPLVGLAVTVGCFGLLILLSVAVALVGFRKNGQGTFLGVFAKPYRQDKSFWEAIPFLTKLTAACIMTFGANLGTQVQMNLGMGVLSMAMVAHILNEPYEQGTMNLLQGISYAVNALTFFQGIFVFDDETTTDSEQDFMIAVIIIAHLATIIWFVTTFGTVLWSWKMEWDFVQSQQKGRKRGSGINSIIGQNVTNVVGGSAGATLTGDDNTGDV